MKTRFTQRLLATLFGLAALAPQRLLADVLLCSSTVITNPAPARVRPVSFRYTEAYRAAHPGMVDQNCLNIVAQEFAEVFPDYVRGSGESPPEGNGEEIREVDTYPLLIYGTAAIQELKQKVEHRSQKAEGRIQELEAENAEFKARLERLGQRIARQFAKGLWP